MRATADSPSVRPRSSQLGSRLKGLAPSQRSPRHCHTRQTRPLFRVLFCALLIASALAVSGCGGESKFETRAKVEKALGKEFADAWNQYEEIVESSAFTGVQNSTLDTNDAGAVDVSCTEAASGYQCSVDYSDGSLGEGMQESVDYVLRRDARENGCFTAKATGTHLDDRFVQRFLKDPALSGSEPNPLADIYVCR